MAEHSGFHDDLWRRLVGTLRALYLITYGSRLEADRAAAKVRAVHTYIHGRTRTQLGIFPRGTPYSAEDPELMLWVHATLVYASLAAYQRFEHALSAADKESYYRDMAIVAQLFGTPAGVIPATLAEFDDYFLAQVRGETIAVTAPAREIARVILRARLPPPIGLLGPAHRLAAAALLPPRVRDGYGLRWTPHHAALLTAAAGSAKLGCWPILQVAARIKPTRIAAPSW